MNRNFLTAFVLASVSLSGCASVARGVNEDVIIRYEPAGATVTTSLNHTCAASPCSIEVARKKAFQVTASRQGYQSQIVQVNTKVSGNGAAGFAGNVVLGGVVGMGVDAATGAAMDHVPNPVIINLVPLEGNGEVVPAGTQPQQSTPDTVPVS